MKHLFYLFSALLLVSLGACKGDDKDQAQEDKEKIEQYLLDHGLTAQEHPSGMYYIITEEGTGDSPTINNHVKIKYKGYFTDGTVFDQTTGSQSAIFLLSDLIEGWQIGIPLLKRGGKGTFLFPSALCYGSNPPPGIPKNAVLIFDIELIDF